MVSAGPTVASAMFIVALTGVTLVMKNRSINDPENLLSSDDSEFYYNLNRIDTQNLPNGSEQFMDFSISANESSNSQLFHRYKRNFSDNYVPKYFASRNWFKIPDINVSKSEIDHEKRNKVKEVIFWYSSLRGK